MDSKLTKAIMLLFLVASPWLMVQAWVLVAAQDETINTMETCPDVSSNCAHLGGEATYRMEAKPTVLERSIERIVSDLAEYITDCDCNILEEKQSESEYFVHFVEHTPFWQFPDDVLITIEKIDETSARIELHSESRLGIGDMGVNPERLERIYSEISG